MPSTVKTLNRPQCIALYALAMEMGLDCEFDLLFAYTLGDVMVNVRAKHGEFCYILNKGGGSKPAPLPTGGS